MLDKQLNKNTSHLINISPQMLMDWIQNGGVILADVRETSEFETERIKSAHSYPLSTFSPESLSKSLKTHNKKEKTLVLMCRSGNRSRQAAEMLIASGLSDIHHLNGGLSNWKVSGFRVWQENSLAQSKSQDPFSFLGE